MAEDKKNEEQVNEQLEMDFPSPDDFESYDEVDSDEVQAELPTDSFSEAQATAAEDAESGCCVR